MYDINSLKFRKKIPNEKDLLDKVTDYEIYTYYIGTFKVGKPFSSPLLRDEHPSFAIFASKKYPGRLFFKDHRGPSGDSITFIKELFNLSYKDTLERIIVDFRLEEYFLISNTNLKQLKPVEYRLDKSSRKEFLASKLDLNITSRGWEQHDLIYWKSHGISKNTLEIFNVVPIKYYWMYGRVYTADRLAYAYKEWKDEELNYKVYQPRRSSNNHKFVNGFLDGTFSGWELLPKKTNIIIITKSAKDCMFLYEHGYYAIAPQGEGYTFKPQVIDILKSKCDKLLLFYDCDEAGLNSAKRNAKEFNIEYITTGDINSKDITDYYKNKGLTSAIKLLTDIIKI